MSENSKMTRRSTVLILTMICCLLWGSAFSCVKIGYLLTGIGADDRMSQMLFAGLRFFLAGLLTLLFGSIIAGKPLLPDKTSTREIAVLSLFQTVLQYTFFYLGLAHTSGTKSSIITASNVFLSIIVSALVFRSEKLTLRKAVGSLIGFAGVVVINLGSSDLGGGFRLNGEGFIFISALSYAFSSGFIKKFSQHSDPVMLSGCQFTLGGAFMIVLSLLLGGGIPVISAKGTAMLLYLALVSSAAFSLWGLLLKYNPVSRIAVFGFMNPVFGVVLSALFLGESAGMDVFRTAAALVLVICGIITVNFSGRKNNLKTL